MNDIDTYNVQLELSKNDQFLAQWQTLIQSKPMADPNSNEYKLWHAECHKLKQYLTGSISKLAKLADQQRDRMRRQAGMSKEMMASRGKGSVKVEQRVQEGDGNSKTASGSGSRATGSELADEDGIDPSMFMNPNGMDFMPMYGNPHQSQQQDIFSMNPMVFQQQQLYQQQAMAHMYEQNLAGLGQMQALPQYPLLNAVPGGSSGLDMNMPGGMQSMYHMPNAAYGQQGNAMYSSNAVMSGHPMMQPRVFNNAGRPASGHFGQEAATGPTTSMYRMDTSASSEKKST